VSVDREPLGPEAAEPLARFLVALHRPAPDDAPRNTWRGVPLSTRAEAVDEWHATLADRDDGLAPDALRHVREVFDRAVRSPIDVDDTWLHGDLHPRNVVGQDGMLAAIVDWGDVCHGDRATDLASLWMLLPTTAARRRAQALVAADRDVSAATWDRARGWAVFFGSILLAAGLQDGDTTFAEAGRRTLQHVCDDD
jgi:aminoglycoside phosphotransferase (APT) family kinase protein